MTSLNNQQASAASRPPDDLVILPADSEYDQAMSANYQHDPGLNSTKVGRTDSYRQAKNSAAAMVAVSSSTENAGGGHRGHHQMRNYNSLPRLGKGAKHSNQQQQRPPKTNNPETRSLGLGEDVQQQPHPRQQRRGGGRKGDDNCQMM